jgi:hypothetical protein
VPTSTLASGTLSAASVSSSSFQTFNVTFDPPDEYLDDGAWYTVVLRQKDDGGNGTNEYLVSMSTGSCGADAKGWERIDGVWTSINHRHFLKVYVAGPTDFTPREDIVAEARVPTSALPACASGCEAWVPVRFNKQITLANMSYYAVVAREEGGSGSVYWRYHGTAGNNTSYGVGRAAGQQPVRGFPSEPVLSATVSSPSSMHSRVRWPPGFNYLSNDPLPSAATAGRSSTT